MVVQREPSVVDDLASVLAGRKCLTAPRRRVCSAVELGARPGLAIAGGESRREYPLPSHAPGGMGMSRAQVADSIGQVWRGLGETRI